MGTCGPVSQDELAALARVWEAASDGRRQVSTPVGSCALDVAARRQDWRVAVRRGDEEVRFAVARADAAQVVGGSVQAWRVLEQTEQRSSTPRQVAMSVVVHVLERHGVDDAGRFRDLRRAATQLSQWASALAAESPSPDPGKSEDDVAVEHLLDFELAMAFRPVVAPVDEADAGEPLARIEQLWTAWVRERASP